MAFRRLKKQLRSWVSQGRQSLNALRLRREYPTEQRGSKKVWLLDPGLRECGGHHQDEARLLLAEATAMDLPCMIIGNQNADPDVLGLPLWRHFRAPGYGMAKRGVSDVSHTFEQNQILLEDLSRLPTGLFRRDDLVLFPAVTRNQILGICRWIAQLSHAARTGAPCPRIAICLMFPPNWLASPKPSAPNKAVEEIYRQAVACLDSAAAAQVVWTCETAALAAEFEPLIGAQPIVLPVVLLPDIQGLRSATKIAADRATPSEPTISILGYTKAEKGSLLVPEIVERVVRARPHARFIVQALSRAAQQEDALVDACRALQPAPEIIRGSVEQETFLRLLQQTDLMLLPYDAGSYGQRGSGLANQATALGIPLVAPVGCAFADAAADENRAVVFLDHDTESIANAVVVALDGLESLKKNAGAIERAAAAEPGYLAALLEAAELAGEFALQRTDQNS